MTALDLTTANAAFAAAIRPFFQAWWDCVYQSDSLAGMFDRNDCSDAADEIRKARLLLSDAATALEAALSMMRDKIASAHGVPVEDMTPLGNVLNDMRREA